MQALSEGGKALDGATGEDLFSATIDAGLHRNSYHRAFIIETCEKRRKVAREDLLSELRARFPVQVLLGD